MDNIIETKVFILVFVDWQGKELSRETFENKIEMMNVAKRKAVFHGQIYYKWETINKMHVETPRK